MTTTPKTQTPSREDELRIPFTAPLLPQVRFQVGEWATGRGLPRDRGEEFVLAVNEVASNAVQHGGGHGLLQVYEQHGALHCQISDEGPGFAREVGASVMCGPETAESGRGLWMVQQLTSHMKITTGTAGTVVTLAVLLPTE
ncbi:hypothetical protein GCM10010129_43930 [Streptomyces fumigatiscleroticus]|nr:hypothetical protein GCM10010129_43930 [Streptomyces fumigatiscleroticus]